ncbi:hypothetical protein NPIL_692671 [Nephila pilipes]|uniref:Uncharacterized protein n=1 Tax=Nephila pilipes TaxID=299642 RepID=A0A8X6QB75_NEPPI|nr:hypothetical protein NPIL_692671 [Nephila pilipes]
METEGSFSCNLKLLNMFLQWHFSIYVHRDGSSLETEAFWEISSDAGQDLGIPFGQWTLRLLSWSPSEMWTVYRSYSFIYIASSQRPVTQPESIVLGISSYTSTPVLILKLALVAFKMGGCITSTEQTGDIMFKLRLVLFITCLRLMICSFLLDYCREFFQIQAIS